MASTGHASSVDALETLTPREAEVLDLIALGLTNTQIAERLALSVHAVKFHLAAIYRKLEAANRTEAASMYLRHARASSAKPIPS